MEGGISLRPYACPNCQLSTTHTGALGTHQKACRRKRHRTETAIAAAAQSSAFLTRAQDEKGRNIGRTEHNDVCEHCLGSRHLLLCSYWNTPWRCTAEALSEVPTGDRMCGLCIAAERRGEDMMQHGLVGEDDTAAGAGFDPSAVDTDDEEGKTDISPAAYDKAGILPYPPNIWDVCYGCGQNSLLS